MRVPRFVTSAVAAIVVLFATGQVLAFNWTASGSFKYQDREFNQNGFTGVTPSLPIRFAKVEVRYKQGGGTQLLATGATDGSGNYSIDVLNDTSTRDIQIRVLTASGVSDLFLQVTNVNGTKVNYAVTTPFFNSHMPNQNLNTGTVTGLIGAGAEAFNVYDVGLNTIEYLKFLNGTRPGSSQELKLQWENLAGQFVNRYLGANTVQVADNSPYNDTVIQHETGHYAIFNFSATDSPFGPHNLSNCNQDLRLAFDEGFATYFGQSVRLHFGLSHPQLYVKMTGAPGAGNLDFYFDVEDEEPFSCKGGTSEATVYATLWDMADAASTPDDSPGIEEFWDAMGSSGPLVWDVMRNYLPSAAKKSVEDFWDGWFVRLLGSQGSMITMFSRHGMDFKHDLAEPNEEVALSLHLPSTGAPFHASYFKDLGNGAGSVDLDYFKFLAVAGQIYKVQTTNLLGDANTSITILGPDGTTVLQSNDDRSALDKSSFINFTAPNTATFYVKSFHSTGLGIYGSYDISVTGTPAQMGSGTYTPSATVNVSRQIVDVGGGERHPSSSPGTFNEEGE
ncbi:MAG: PPC domain-containing protein [Acidobacteria bacterium]|nr:PPC domain-containing protein [Acidobacteriota bacterium]